MRAKGLPFHSHFFSLLPFFACSLASSHHVRLQTFPLSALPPSLCSCHFGWADSLVLCSDHTGQAEAPAAWLISSRLQGRENITVHWDAFMLHKGTRWLTDTVKEEHAEPQWAKQIPTHSDSGLMLFLLLTPIHTTFNRKHMMTWKCCTFLLLVIGCWYRTVMDA